MRLYLLGPILALATFHGVPAHADARPPRYDTDGLCNQRANTPDGYSPETNQKCLVEQDDALDSIKRIWEQTPEYIQNGCDERTRTGGDPDYQSLQNCIRTQMRQRQPDAVIPGADLQSSPVPPGQAPSNP